MLLQPSVAPSNDTGGWCLCCLQANIKKDPDGYKDEFLLQVRPEDPSSHICMCLLTGCSRLAQQRQVPTSVCMMRLLEQSAHAA